MPRKMVKVLLSSASYRSETEKGGFGTSRTPSKSRHSASDFINVATLIFHKIPHSDNLNLSQIFFSPIQLLEETEETRDEKKCNWKIKSLDTEL